MFGKPQTKTLEQKIADEATKQWMELYSVRDSFRIAKQNAAHQVTIDALAIVTAERKAAFQREIAEREAVNAAIVAAGGLVFKADTNYRTSKSKKQVAFAQQLAREIRDSGATNDSAHSLSKHFTIDTLIAMRDAIKAGKTIVTEF